MNCEKCHDLLSEFLDGTLTGDERMLLTTHLDECLSCACVREELHSIVGVAQESREYFAASPPNERALWLRVRNTIESELRANEASAARSLAGGGARGNFLNRLMNKRWALSLPQLTTAVAALVVGVSLATVFGVQSLWNSNRQAGVVASADAPKDATPGFSQKRIPKQEIDYLMQRVEERKGRWNPRMRAAFDRNMTVIDAAVNDSLSDLNESPHDEVSEEALDAALREKMELLKEFSDL